MYPNVGFHIPVPWIQPVGADSAFKKTEEFTHLMGLLTFGEGQRLGDAMKYTGDTPVATGPARLPK